MSYPSVVYERNLELIREVRSLSQQLAEKEAALEEKHTCQECNGTGEREITDELLEWAGTLEAFKLECEETWWASGWSRASGWKATAGKTPHAALQALRKEVGDG